ncbi:hypothetical protein BKA01_004968 [Pseudonocardia eucalypti]|nr:hypothetical protein [Pseudonocardia eucalypti]
MAGGHGDLPVATSATRMAVAGASDGRRLAGQGTVKTCQS